MQEETNTPKNSRPTIFLVEEDDDTRPNLTKNLRKLGYRLLVAADIEDAREWLSADGHINADVVLINLVGKSLKEAFDAGQKLRQHGKYDGHTPLVVIPEKIPEELEGTNVNVSGNDWVCYYTDSEQLRKLLGRLTGKDSA